MACSLRDVRLALLVVLALPAGAFAQAQAPAAIQGPQGASERAAEPLDVRRRNDPGAPPLPLNIQLRGEGLKLPQDAEAPVVLVPPSGDAPAAPEGPGTTPKPPPGPR